MRDETFYGLAAREIAERQFNQALMAKAYALALGDPDKTRALYIGMRADQLKEEASILAVNARARERQRKAAEDVAREEAERQRVAAEKKRKKDEDVARRRREEIEAQRVGDAWSRGESANNGQESPSKNRPPQNAEALKPSPSTSSKPSPPMSPEELDRIIESLKKAQNSKTSFL
jgi:hypothetical protein